MSNHTQEPAKAKAKGGAVNHFPDAAKKVQMEVGVVYG